MILTPTDIARFIHCPYLFQTKQKSDLFENTLTLYEKCIVEAIKATESHCLINDRILTSKKIITRWDKIWWPTAAQAGMAPKEIENLSINAAQLFIDYCDYNIAHFPTAGIDIPSEVLIGKSILKTKADLIKVDTAVPYKNIYILEFGNKPVRSKDIILDPAVRTLLYSFSLGEEQAITYTYLSFNEKSNKFLVTSAVMRHNNLEEIKQMLRFIEYGIRTNVSYMNPWNCGECKICRNS